MQEINELIRMGKIITVVAMVIAILCFITIAITLYYEAIHEIEKESKAKCYCEKQGYEEYSLYDFGFVCESFNNDGSLNHLSRIYYFKALKDKKIC